MDRRSTFCKDCQWANLWRDNQRRPPDQHLSKKVLIDKIRQEADTATSNFLKELFANPALNKLAENPLLMTMENMMRKRSSAFAIASNGVLMGNILKTFPMILQVFPRISHLLVGHG